MFSFSKRNFWIFFVPLLFLGVLNAFFYFQKPNAGTVDIQHEQVRIGKEYRPKAEPANSLSGIGCDNYNRRPYAIMLAEDTEAKPLSGIGLADLVIEMPVVTGSITRMMAVFVCENPEEIGSVRSVRHDFIPLAQGYDAILAHWGGSHFALEELKSGTTDNLDALPNYFEAFYRKRGISAPHNGFTSMERIVNAAENLGYRQTSRFKGYKFLKISDAPVPKSRKILEIGYRYPYNVTYKYNPETNSYLRWRGDDEEIDKITSKQVEAKNIVVMLAASRQIGGGYNDVDVLGEGRAVVYRNGEEIPGTWVKKEAEDVLKFFDEDEIEIAFVPGKIWIEIVEPSTVIKYDYFSIRP